MLYKQLDTHLRCSMVFFFFCLFLCGGVMLQIRPVRYNEVETDETDDKMSTDLGTFTSRKEARATDETHVSVDVSRVLNSFITIWICSLTVIV